MFDFISENFTITWEKFICCLLNFFNDAVNVFDKFVGFLSQSRLVPTEMNWSREEKIVFFQRVLKTSSFCFRTITTLNIPKSSILEYLNFLCPFDKNIFVIQIILWYDWFYGPVIQFHYFNNNRQ